MSTAPDSKHPSDSPLDAVPNAPSSGASLPHDPLWPRTGAWPSADEGDTEGTTGTSGTTGTDRVDLALVGIPTSRTSISASQAHLTPAAIREALRKYSGHVVATPSAERARGFESELVIDEALRIVDAGDCVDPDSPSGETAAIRKVRDLAARSKLVVALGGDNALTVPAALGIAGDDLANAGLITFDAHHDLRDGRSNGSPVRRLVEAGLNPRLIVQVGIADFANSRAYRQRAKEWGITVIHRDELHDRPMADVIAEALEIAGAGGGPIHVDLDVDVCDRSVAPGCPASIPGGLQAHELRRAARLLASDPQVRGIDIAEVDVTADSPDGRTVRLAALLVLEAAYGLAIRPTE